MKKIIAFLLVVTISFAILPTISAPAGTALIITPGAPVMDICVPDYYSLGTFTLAPERTASFNIPQSA